MKRIIVLLMSLFVIISLYWLSPYHAEKKQPVALLQPTQQNIRDMIVLQGTIVDPAPIHLYAKSTSIIEKILVSPGDKVVSGQPLIQLRLSETNRDNLNVRSNLNTILQSGDLSQFEAVLERILLKEGSAVPENQSEVYQLYSATDCIVKDIHVSLGDTVSELFPCISLYDPNALLAEAAVDELSIGRLQTDMLCEISVPALAKTALPGSITSIAPYAVRSVFSLGKDSPKTTVRFSLTSEQELAPGYRAEIRVITAYKASALLVPFQCISQDDTGKEYVMMLHNGEVKKRYILTGSELDDQTEIQSGLTVDDIILLDPNSAGEGDLIQYAQTGIADPCS